MTDSTTSPAPPPDDRLPARPPGLDHLPRGGGDGPPDPPPPHPPAPPHPPHPPPPRPPPAPVPPPGVPSITSWTRLESQCRDASMATSTRAQVADPLWFLTRQWQIGEFQAEDTGTPVGARVAATTALVSRCHLGPLAAGTQTQAAAYDPTALPLEARVERRPLRPATPDDAHAVGLAVEAGLHFLRLLASQAVSRDYRAAFVARFALAETARGPAGFVDDATVRALRLMNGRAPDARRIADEIRRGHVAQWLTDPALAIAAGDRAEVQAAAQAWLAWYDGLASEPGTGEPAAWDPPHLEYAVSVSARLSDVPTDEFTFTCTGYDQARLDWSAFDFDGEVNLGTAGDQAWQDLVQTTLPAPVTFRGAPAPRFWEMEDAALAYGLVPVGPTDLAQLMMIEYASTYGNDWFVVPLELPVGSVTRVQSVVVTDSFGVHQLLRPLGDPALPAANWSMWQQAFIRRPGEAAAARPLSNLFFLPPVAGRALEGPTLEDVLFLRDEMANVAWAIERSIESPLEQPVRRERLEAPPASADAASGVAAATQNGGPLRYTLASTLPAHWIPLVPVQLRDAQGRVLQRLRRGAVLQPDGSARLHTAASQVLLSADPFIVPDEEIPREGLRITFARRLTRWIDGSTWLWNGWRREIGRGEGSSGARFDIAEE